VHESLSAREWSYVAGSRAREAVHLYAERATAEDLQRIMGRSHKKDTALDYATPAPAMTKTACSAPKGAERHQRLSERLQRLYGALELARLCGSLSLSHRIERHIDEVRRNIEAD
jgi:hypothetical protein